MALPKYQKATAAAKAESSSKKRAAAKEPEHVKEPEPVRKRGKIAERKAAANAAAEKRAAIASAIAESSSLPQAVREVLCSSLQGVFSSAGPFHPFQEKILRMVNQTLNDMETESLSKRHKAANSLTAVREDLARREKEQADAEAALESAKTLVQSKEKLLSEGLSDLRSCEEGLPKAQEELSRRDTLIGEKVMEIEQAQEAVTKMGEDDRCEEVVRTMLRDLSFPLDNLQEWSQVQSEVSNRINMLRDVVSQAGKSRKELVAKLKACQAGIDGAREKQQTHETAVKEAQSECEKCAATLKEAAGNYTQQKKITTQTTKAYCAAQVSVTQIQEGALAAFKEIAREIEQRHEVSFLVVNTPTQEEPLPSSSLQLQMTKQIEASAAGTLDATGTPVIDRAKREAVLRRRSAALPLQFFSRKSLMSRRASLVRMSMSHETKSFKSCGSDSDTGDATMETDLNNPEMDKNGANQVISSKTEEECNAIEGLTDVPTPHRNSVGSAA